MGERELTQERILVSDALGPAQVMFIRDDRGQLIQVAMDRNARQDALEDAREHGYEDNTCIVWVSCLFCFIPTALVAILVNSYARQAALERRTEMARYLTRLTRRLVWASVWLQLILAVVLSQNGATVFGVVLKSQTGTQGG